MNVTSSSPLLEEGDSPTVFLGGWAPFLGTASPTTEIRRGPKGRPEHEILAGWWSWAHDPLGVWTRSGGKLLPAKVSGLFLAW